MSSARLLVLTAFLISIEGAKATLNEIFGLEHEVGKNNNALETWYGSAKCEVAPEIEIQKN